MAYTREQGMYAYLVTGGTLCPLQADTYADVRSAIDAYIADTGEDPFSEVETSEDGEQSCVEEQEWE